MRCLTTIIVSALVLAPLSSDLPVFAADEAAKQAAVKPAVDRPSHGRHGEGR